MKCKCGNEAVIYRAFEGRALCKRHFLESVDIRISRTIGQNRLIKRGEHIAVGVSGGKDSSLTLYQLKQLQPKFKLKISAILIDEGIKGYRDKTIKKARQLCKKLKVPLYIGSFKKEFDLSLDEMMKKAKAKRLKHPLNACTYCGVFRRHLLNKIARKIKADKLAIGHNLDDEAQSIMANWIRGDMLRAIRVGAKAYIVKDKILVPRIKPLRDVPEKETALYAILKGFDASFDECPYASESFRWEIRDMINDLEAKHSGTKFSIVKTFDRLQPSIRKMIKVEKLGKCKKCGEVSSQAECKVCLLREIIR